MILTTLSLSTYVLASSLLLTIPSTVAVVATVKGRAEEAKPARETQHKGVRWEDEYEGECVCGANSYWATPSKEASSSSSGGGSYRTAGEGRSIAWGKTRLPTSRSPTPSLTSSQGSRSTSSPPRPILRHSSSRRHHYTPSLSDSEDDDPNALARARTLEDFLGDYVRREELEDRMEAAEMARREKERERKEKGGWGQWLGLVRKERELTPEEQRAKAFREWVDRE